LKILHTVEFYNPSVGGMQEVVRQISEKLILLGHSVTVATSYDENRKKNELNGVQIQSFRLKGNDVRGYQALEGEIRRYQDFIINSQFDVITIFAAQQWSADLILPLLKNIKSRKIFVPTGFSGLFNPEYRNYFENMKTYMKYFDMNVFLSDDYRDINFARENGIEKRTLIPNGAGEDEFLARQEINIRRNLGIREDCFLILHVGSHTGLKGHDEMFKIFQKAKINNSVLLIVGNYFKSETPLLKKIIKFLINLFIFHEIGFNRCPESCRSAERKFNLRSEKKR